jgi:hypothetical protein
VVMPDHLHLFVRGDANFALALRVKGLKRTISTASTTWNKDFRWQLGPGVAARVLTRSPEGCKVTFFFGRGQTAATCAAGDSRLYTSLTTLHVDRRFDRFLQRLLV